MLSPNYLHYQYSLASAVNNDCDRGHLDILSILPEDQLEKIVLGKTIWQQLVSSFMFE
jgi:hypothetical protein